MAKAAKEDLITLLHVLIGMSEEDMRELITKVFMRNILEFLEEAS